MPLTEDQERAFILNGDEPAAPTTLPYTGAPSAVLNPSPYQAQEQQIVAGDVAAPDPIGSALKPYQLMAEYFDDRLNSGVAMTRRGFDGYAAMQDPTKYDAISKDVAMEKLAQDRKQRIDAYHENLGMWKNFGPTRVLGSVIEQLPNLEKTLEAGLIGAAPGAGVGAAAGLVGGPLAELSVPAGALMGAVVGGKTAGFAAQAQIMAGDMYLTLREKGVEHSKAKNIAMAVGLANGTLETLEISRLGSVFGKAVSDELKKNVVKATLADKFAEFAKQAAWEVNNEQLQEIVNIIGENLGGVLDLTKKETWGELRERLVETTAEAARASVGLTGGAAGLGKVTGLVKERFAKSDSPVDAVKHVFEAYKEGDQEAKQQGPFAVTTSVSGRVMNAKESPAAAKDALVAAEVRRDDLLNERDEIERRGEEVPQDLQDAIKQAKEDVAFEREAKKVTEFEDAKAKLEEEAKQPGITAERKAEVAKEANAIEKKLNDVQSSIAKRQSEVRLRQVERDLKQAKSDLYLATTAEKADLIMERNLLSKEINQRKESGAATKQRTDRIQRLQEKINAIENAFDPDGKVKPDAPANIRQLVKDVEKLTEERDTLETVRDLAQENLLDSELLKELNVQLPNASARALVKLAQTKLRQVAERVQLATKREIKQIQKLVDYLKRTSGLSKSDQAKLEATRNFDSPEKLQKKLSGLISRIDELKEKAAKSDAVQRLNRLQEKIEPKKVGDQKVSRYSPKSGIQQVLDLYSKYINDKDGSARSDLQSRLDALDGQTIPSSLKLESEIAAEVGDISTMSAAEVEALNDTLENIIENGLDARKRELATRAEQTQALIQRVLDAIDAGRGIAEKLTRPGRRTRKEKPGTLTKFTRRIGSALFSWEGKLETMLQFNKDAKEVAALISKLGVWDTVQAELAGKRKSMDRMRAHLVKATGKKESEVVKLMIRGASQNSEFTIAYKDANGTTQNLTLTPNEGVQLLMQMKDDTLHAALQDTEVGNAFTLTGENSTQVRLTAALEEINPAYVQMADGMHAFYKESYKDLAAAYLDEFGLTLADNPNYSGFAHRFYVRNKEVQAYQELKAQLDGMSPGALAAKRKTAATPGTVKDRTGTKQALDLKDAFLNAIEQIDQVEHWNAWRGRSDLRAVFSDERVKNLLRAEFGGEFVNDLNGHLTDMVQGHFVKNKAWLNFLSTIMRNAGTAFLGLKPISFVKQITSIVNIALHIPTADFVKGVVEFHANPIAAANEIRNSEWYQARYSDFDRTITGATIDGDLNQLRDANIRNWVLAALRLGDKYVALAGGHAVYKYHLSKSLSKEAAMSKAGAAVNTTQSSGTIDQMNAIARNPHWKVLVMFTQQPTRLAEFQLVSIRKFVNNPSGENLGNMLRTIVITHLGQSLFVAADVAYIWGLAQAGAADEDEVDDALWRWWSETLIGPAFPYLGDAVKSAAALTDRAIQKATAEEDADLRHIPDPFDFNTIPLDALNKTKKLYQDVLKGGEDGVWETDEVLRIVVDYSRSVNLLLPVGGGVPIEPIAKLLGRYFKAVESEGEE